MRNVDKKWTLFIVASVICLYGICYTLVNVTFAVKSMPVDMHFDDINFYKCVIDAYNDTYSLKLDYDDMMDYSKLNQIKSLNCNNREVKSIDKISSIKGIELMSALEEFVLTYTDVSNINLSSNKNIKKVNFEGNKLVDTLYVYNGEKVVFNDGFKIGSNLVNNKIVWNNLNEEIISVNAYSHAYGIKDGYAVVNGESSLGYQVINNIYVVSIYSLVYDIEDKYIYVDSIKNFDITDILCDDENVTLELYYNSMELYVKYNDNVLKKFILVERDV